MRKEVGKGEGIGWEGVMGERVIGKAGDNGEGIRWD